MDTTALHHEEARSDYNKSEAHIKNYAVEKQEQLVAVSVPVPAPDGTVSPKTPIFHLPVYKITLSFDDDSEEASYCDLAELSDFMERMRRFNKPSNKIEL